MIEEREDRDELTTGTVLYDRRQMEFMDEDMSCFLINSNDFFKTIHTPAMAEVA